MKKSCVVTRLRHNAKKQKRVKR